MRGTAIPCGSAWHLRISKTKQGSGSSALAGLQLKPDKVFLNVQKRPRLLLTFNKHNVFLSDVTRLSCVLKENPAFFPYFVSYRIWISYIIKEILKNVPSQSQAVFTNNFWQQWVNTYGHKDLKVTGHTICIFDKILNVS